MRGGHRPVRDTMTPARRSPVRLGVDGTALTILETESTTWGDDPRDRVSRDAYPLAPVDRCARPPGPDRAGTAVAPPAPAAPADVGGARRASCRARPGGRCRVSAAMCGARATAHWPYRDACRRVRWNRSVRLGAQRGGRPVACDGRPPPGPPARPAADARPSLFVYAGPARGVIDRLEFSGWRSVAAALADATPAIGLLNCVRGHAGVLLARHGLARRAATTRREAPASVVARSIGPAGLCCSSPASVARLHRRRVAPASLDARRWRAASSRSSVRFLSRAGAILLDDELTSGATVGGMRRCARARRCARRRCPRRRHARSWNTGAAVP